MEEANQFSTCRFLRQRTQIKLVFIFTLQERATQDKDTGRPLLYVSSDAHALRRYVGDTWELPWKMVNGIRVWCEDAKTGQVVHLGGEFTWGNCREVGRRF